MTELGRALIAESAHAAPSHILEAIPDGLEHTVIPGAPHTIYQELWHLAFWQTVTLEWISGVETPYPEKTTDPFPTEAQVAAEPWPELRSRFLASAEAAAAMAEDTALLATTVRCPSPPGRPVRLMTVHEQLVSWAAHNAYHLGRIVLLRQLLGSWPPPSGGLSW